jgi:trans-2,3-dihydro-3-hydroxyanthranilate isomerase
MVLYEGFLMRRYSYCTVDVFTTTRFGGGPLAVLPDARGLTTAEMQAITREFNYSETTFVLPPEDPSHTRRVRIFTPGSEVPFAGHPTLGTAHVLAAIGEIPQGTRRVVLGEEVGPVPVTLQWTDGVPSFAQFSVAKLPEVLPLRPTSSELAAMLSLEPEEVLTGAMAPQPVSCGLPYTVIPLRSLDAVRRARFRTDLWERALAGSDVHLVFVFALEAEDPAHQVHARMFAPGVSIAEDPACGSGCSALGGYLGMRDTTANGTLRWAVEQGYEMGRPSLLNVECEKRDGVITAIRVGGNSVMVCQGEICV